MTFEGVPPSLAALGIGIALAAAPGPVQAVLLSESVRGGVSRGFQALAGVHLTFGIVLISLALGFSVATPHGLAVRLLKAAGGLFLLWLAVDGLRSKAPTGAPLPRGRRTIPPILRGALSIVINPGGWLFLTAVASPLLVAATHHGGTGSAVLAAAGLVGGAAFGDAVLVLVGGLGLRRTGERVGGYVRTTLAVILAVFGLWLLLSGALP